MSTTASIQPMLTPANRLGLTLCLAVVLHAVIILGIVFKPGDKIKPRYDYLEVVIVQQSGKLEEDTDLMAQTEQRGGGEIPREMRPATPLPLFPPGELAEVEVATPVKTQAPGPAVETEVESVDDTTPSPAEVIPQLNVESKAAEIVKKEPPANPGEHVPSASALLTRSFTAAAIDAQVKRKLEAKATRPKRKFISASTREYKYAAYMEAWRAKVERVGNLNYPDEARKRRVSGNLVLDVALNSDGSVDQITLRRSSGYQILDEAAIRIVELASPYAPFPEAIRAETDILHITRTWQFLNNRGFR